MIVRIVALCASTLAALSVYFVCCIVITTPAALEQLAKLELPLSALGERIVEMIIPVVLSALSALGAISSIRIRLGRIAFFTASFSWLVIWLAIGGEGFRTLF